MKFRPSYFRLSNLTGRLDTIGQASSDGIFATRYGTDKDQLLRCLGIHKRVGDLARSRWHAETRITPPAIPGLVRSMRTTFK